MAKKRKVKAKKTSSSSERQIFFTVLKQSIFISLEATVVRFLEMARFLPSQYKIIPKSEKKLYEEKSNRVKKDLGVDMFNTVMSLREPVIIEGTTQADVEKLAFVLLELKFSDKLEGFEVLCQNYIRGFENDKARSEAAQQAGQKN